MSTSEISKTFEVEEELLLKKRKKYKNLSDKDCVCGGHDIKKNKRHNSTKKRIEIRKYRREKLKLELDNDDIYKL